MELVDGTPNTSCRRGAMSCEVFLTRDWDLRPYNIESRFRQLKVLPPSLLAVELSALPKVSGYSR
jgi:hypothetical protein